MRRPDGETRRFTASLRPFLTHEDSRPFYEGKASFELTEVAFTTSIGTYPDSPRHRWPDGRDIAGLRLDEVVLEGVRVDVSAAHGGEPVGPAQVELSEDIGGKAVLIRFGWDRFWGTDDYEAWPYIDRRLIATLIERGAKLVGVDAFNIDSAKDPERPAQSEFLKRDILVVENLANLGALPSSGFRFFAVPIKAVGVAAMTVRAFAEVER